MIEIIKYLDESGAMYILCLLGSIYLYVIIDRQYHQIISLKKQVDADARNYTVHRIQEGNYFAGSLRGQLRASMRNVYPNLAIV